MKASELRIGNWVFDENGQVVPVEALTYYETIETGDVTYDNYRRTIKPQPIPLTEEWLLKFGFVRGDNKGKSDSFYGIAVGGSELFINPDNGVVWIERNDNVFNNPALIEYVHQLQNLYFALTGEELTIQS